MGGGGGRTRGLEGYGRRENGVREEGETTGNKDWNGMGNEWNMLTSKLVKYTVLDALFKLDWKKVKTKTTWLLKLFPCFGLLYFFLTCQVLKARFELSRVNLYRNDLKGNENYFELTGSRFELSRVRLTEGKIIVDLWRKPRRNRFWFTLARGSS